MVWAGKLIRSITKAHVFSENYITLEVCIDVADSIYDSSDVESRWKFFDTFINWFDDNNLKKL